MLQLLRPRVLMAVAALAALAGLLAWQYQRNVAVRACIEAGGNWDGAHSACQFPARPIILREDLRRG